MRWIEHHFLSFSTEHTHIVGDCKRFFDPPQGRRAALASAGFSRCCTRGRFGRRAEGRLGASVALQRQRTAMARSAELIGGDESFEGRGAASERKLARLAVARSAPPWLVSLTNRHKKGVGLCRVMAEADPEGYRYAAARRTGIPILRALSTRLLVMPEPGKARRPFGRKFSRTSLRRKGAALPSRSQLGLHTT